MDRLVEGESGPLQVTVVEARMWGSKVAVPRLGDPGPPNEVDGPTECEVTVRATVRSRAEFLLWQALVGYGPLYLARP